MHRDLKETIRLVRQKSNKDSLDFVELLKLVDQHYDQMESTLSRSMAAAAPTETIFDSVTDALFSVDAKGTILNCNRICVRYFGKDKNDMLGKSLSLIVPAAQGLGMKEFLAPFLTNIDDTNIDISGGEVEAVRHNGEKFTAQINASSMKSDIDCAYVVSIRDITDRKTAESTLRENEERYRALVENAPDAILVIDVDKFKISDVNDRACELFNLSRKRLLNAGPQQISAKMQSDGSPSFGVHRGYIKETLAGGNPSFEWLHVDSDGNEIPCEIRLSRLPSADRRLVRASITNIAERKKKEAQAFSQNKILEMIASNVSFDRVLRAICRSVEELGEGMHTALMRLDYHARTLSVEQAPNLNMAFRLALDFTKIEAKGISCGVAAHTGRPQLVEDIAADKGWRPFATLAEQNGIKAVWSFPVVSEAQRTVGTLDVYLDKCCLPNEYQLERLDRLVRLAGIAAKRKIDEDRLKVSEARYRGLFENVVDGVYIASRDGQVIAVNPALVEMLGYSSAGELKEASNSTNFYVNPGDRDRVFAQLDQQGFVRNFEGRLRRKDGTEIVVLENSRAICDERGETVAHEGTITDITDRKIAETRIFQEKERAQVTLQSIGDGVITTDADGLIDYINPVAQELTGCEVRMASGKSIDQIMTIVNDQTRTTIENPSMRCLKEGRVIALAENSVLITQDGNEVPIQNSAAPIRDRIGNIIGSVMVFHDVSKESRLFRQLSYQASHDSLTDLINRREFENRLVGALDQSYENSEIKHAMLYLDLDQFKVVNDTFGHIAGDELLRGVSQIIQSKIRSTDTVARLSGDEFGILLDRCDEQRALEVAEAIRSAIEAYRFAWKEAAASVRCSIGIVMVSSASPGVAHIMSSADVACYSAKDLGRNQIYLYQDRDVSARHEEMKWVTRITSAVEDERLELFYQPIAGIGSRENDAHGHYELLLRMRDENGKLVQPDLFIPAAERYNLMSMLDRWVIRETLARLVDRAGENGVARYTLSINLSGNSLSEDRFLEFLVNELKRQELPAGALCFEITETAAISNLSRVIHFMNALKKQGCLFSLDDFGSGLSSFAYLKNLPVDFLKIDGHFISNVAEDKVDESMVKAISEVGRAMGIETIAERVESEKVLQKLASLGIEYAQGYYIARPASIDGFEPWFEDSIMALSQPA